MLIKISRNKKKKRERGVPAVVRWVKNLTAAADSCRGVGSIPGRGTSIGRGWGHFFFYKKREKEILCLDQSESERC